LASAVKAFEKKFKDKTKNNWAQRGSFNPVAGKYTLIEMADDDEDDAPVS
jgi:poly [ADP-ribose] polymerase